MTTNTGNPGGDASVVINNAGNATAAVWDYTFNIPKGAEKGDTGTGVSIIGSIDQVGPPNAGDYPGISNGDIVVDSNGDGWLWDGADFTNVGPIRGPEGPAGDAASVSATASANQVACDEPASVVVVNNGTSSAAQFAFSFNLPEGCKGDRAKKDAHGIRTLRSILRQISQQLTLWEPSGFRPHRKLKRATMADTVEQVYVWDGNDWTPVVRHETVRKDIRINQRW